MRPLDVLLGALRSARAHSLRFALTALGIIWGSAVLTYIQANMDGFDRHWQEQTTKVGAHLVILFPGTVPKPGIGERAARPLELEFEDVERIAALQSVAGAAPNLFVGTLLVRADHRTKLVNVTGVSQDTAWIRKFEVATGRFISEDDVGGQARVVFLGAAAAERLFGRRPPLGEIVRIEQVPFRVIGVSEEKGEQNVGVGGGADDEQVMIPYSTAQRWFTQSDTVGSVIFAARSARESWGALARVRALLGLHHGFGPDAETALGAFNIDEVLQLIRTLGLGLRLFFTAAGIITLLVGAVGVMNIMLVVVHERTREIGLTKAVGASNRAVFAAFLAETVLLTSASGAIGLLLGIGAVRLAAAAVVEGSMFTHVPLIVPATLIKLTLTLVGVGIVAGVLPAVRAARTEPAVALRAT